jgi:uncharacterized protein (DUF362 family)
MTLVRTLLKSTDGSRACAPLPENAYRRKGKSLVSKVGVGKDLKASVRKAVDLIGGFSKAIKKGDAVLLKPNYVFPDPYPCCTDNEFLRAVIQLVKEQQPSKIVVGECCFGTYSTREVMKTLGALDVLKDEGVELLAFEEGEWETVRLKSDVLDDLAFPKQAFAFDKIIALPCLKTHRLARFTMSLKLMMGFTHPRDRWTKIHPGSGSHEARIGDFNKAIHPNLIILDGRKCFVTEGPRHGHTETPNIVMASGDRIALDVEAVRVLQSYKANNLLDQDDPWNYGQIARAVQNKLGARSQDEVEVVE